MLSKPESFLAAGDQFNLAKSTSHQVFCNIINIITNLRHDYIVWPNANERHRISETLQAKSGKVLFNS